MSRVSILVAIQKLVSGIMGWPALSLKLRVNSEYMLGDLELAWHRLLKAEYQ